MLKRWSAFLLILLLLLFCICSGCAGNAAPALTKYEGSFLDVFDTVTRVVVYAESEDAAKRVIQRTHELLLTQHKLFDIYNEYEGINNLKTVNDAAGGDPVPVDGEIIDLLTFAKDMYGRTEGTVNVALGSVLSLWHEYREAGINDPEHAALPPMDALQAANLHTRIEGLVIDRDNGTVYLADPDMRLDVGSVAKGYAAQVTVDLLRSEGITGVLLSVGGNVCTVGGKPDGSDWKIGIQAPAGDGYLCTVAAGAEDLSVVTSGSYQRVYTVEGKRYHHIIDPATLMPATGYVSVTVLCNESGMADALSTALFVLPLDKGRALIDSVEGADALWVDEAGNRTMTPGFEARLAD